MVKISDLHPGMRVKIVGRPLEHNWSRNMNAYLSNIMTVREIQKGYDYVSMVEDEFDINAKSCGQTGWCWFPDMIECIVDDPDAAVCPPKMRDLRGILRL